jgi:hypothetical protein
MPDIGRMSKDGHRAEGVMLAHELAHQASPAVKAAVAETIANYRTTADYEAMRDEGGGHGTTEVPK